MSSYKQNFKKQITESAKKAKPQISTFFNRRNPTSARLRAFKSFGEFTEEADVQKALGLLRNSREPIAIREAALSGLTNALAKDEGLISEVIELLEYESTPSSMRIGALRTLQAISFSSPVFSAVKPRYFEVLRSLVSNRSKYVRREAQEYLALEKDEFLQRKLVEGLQNQSAKVAEPEVAIQLLSYDLHSDLFPILKDIAKNPPNQRAKKEALRNLANDPESKELLVKTLQDGKEDPEIRHVCAISLEVQAPDEVEIYAKDIIADDGENDELKAALLNSLNHLPGHESLKDDQVFMSKLQHVQGVSDSPNLKKAYQEYLRKDSPPEKGLV